MLKIFLEVAIFCLKLSCEVHVLIDLLEYIDLFNLFGNINKYLGGASCYSAFYSTLLYFSFRIVIADNKMWFAKVAPIMPAFCLLLLSQGLCIT